MWLSQKLRAARTADETAADLGVTTIGGDRAGVPERVLTGIRKLRDRSSTVVVVTHELFSDGVCYDPETAAYLACLAQLNRVIAAQADRVYEVVCGIPVCWKGE